MCCACNLPHSVGRSVWIRHRWLFSLWYPAPSCGSPNSLSQAPAAKCIQSSSNCNTWLPRELPLAAAAPGMAVAPAGLEVKLLSLRSSPAHVVTAVGGPVQAESKPLSRTSWEFWCLHGASLTMSQCARCSPGAGLSSVSSRLHGRAGCPHPCDHPQDQGGICIVWDTHLG